MRSLLHKNILIQEKYKGQDLKKITIHGNLMGWTDGDKILDFDETKKFFKKILEENSINTIEVFMKGIVGSCIVEILKNNEIYFFASCASSGFYWLNEKEVLNFERNYLVSNDEGKFFRYSLRNGHELSDGAIMNAILSHQSVIRAPFFGLMEGTYRCQPGFYVKFSTDRPIIKSFIIDDVSKSRVQQDIKLSKKMRSLSKIYFQYSKLRKSKVHVSFSGGVDSTFLLINFKNALCIDNHGHYIKRDKIPELKIAKEIAKITKSKINFVDPHKNFSYLDVRKRAAIGLSTLNGIHYMKHSFQSSPFERDDLVERLLLTGQNSDTMFHIDTFAASSFTTGIIRFLKMSSGIFARFKTTIIYYKFLLILRFFDNENFIPENIKKTFTYLSEHGSIDISLSPNINKIIVDYKYKNYVLPFDNWLKNEFYPNLSNKSVTSSEKINQVARIARWLRTIGNFHQQYQNISTFEKTIICTPFSEGPIATELLTYKLGLIDIFNPKIFLHNLIKNNLGISYENVRKKVLGGRLIDFPFEALKLVKKFLIRVIRKFNNNISMNNPRPDDIVNDIDLYNLREVLGHKKGTVNRLLLDYISDNDCKKYLNYLYDCIELKNKSIKLNKVVGMRLCRLVNLQLMLTAEESF